jgi:hypothetical protein
VRLLFAETSGGFITGPGERQFNVIIDGTTVLTNFDIYAAVGKDVALVKAFPADVTASPLVVQFTPGSIQNPKVNAIEVVAVPGGD